MSAFKLLYFQRPLKFFLLPCLFFSLLIPLPLIADTLFLKDGTTITGKIKNAGPSVIVIHTTIGDLTIARNTIIKMYDLYRDPIKIDANNEQLTRNERNALASSISEESVREFLLKNPKVIGLGLVLGYGLGTYIEYGYNFSLSSQLHLQYDSKSNYIHLDSDSCSLIGEYPNITNETIYACTSIFTEKLLATYRFFPISSNGLYFGAGAGIANSTFLLTKISSYSSANSPSITNTTYEYAYKSRLRGAFAVLELGLQSRIVSEYNNYYLNVGIQLAKYLYQDDSFDLNQFNNSPYMQNIALLHEEQMQISQFMFGFGFLF